MFQFLIFWLIVGVIVLVSVNLYAEKTNRLWAPPGCIDDLLLVRWMLIILVWPIVIFVVALILIPEWIRKKK